MVAKIDCCRAAKDCACKEREFQKRKQTTKIGGGTVAVGLMTLATAGGVVTTSVIVLGVAGSLTFGTCGIVGLGITAAVSASAGGGIGMTHHKDAHLIINRRQMQSVRRSLRLAH